MKLVMTNEEWERAGWLHRFIAGQVGGLVLLLILAALILVPIFFVYVLTIIPLKIYLALILVVLLVLVFRKRTPAEVKDHARN